MVKCGAWGEDAAQLHRFYGWKEIQANYKAPFHVSEEECYIDEKKTYGYVCVTDEDVKEHPEYMCDAGEMSWNLKIEKLVAFNVGYGANSLFRKLNSFEMFWHAEGIKTEYSGTIWLDGEEYEVIPEKSYGYADKNWGGDFTSPWLWISSCNLTSLKTGKKLNNSAFEAGGGRPKAFGISIPRKLPNS